MVMQKTETQRNFVAFALGIVGVTVMMLTLMKSQFVIGDLWNPADHQQRSLDLVLFNGFVDAPVWYGPWVNSVGNVLLFLPVGALVQDLLQRSSRHPVLWAILIGFTASLGIEVAQFVFAVGYSDVDDLLLNTVGAALGAWWAARTGPRSRRVFTIVAVAGCLAVLTAMTVG